VEALVGHITEKEFKGNLLVIMSGYKDEVDKMFARANPGLRSRFDKVRISFPAWTGEQAFAAAVASIENDGKTIAADAKAELKRSFVEMSKLPSWASARDIFEAILPAMYAKRAARIATHARLGGSVPDLASEDIIEGIPGDATAVPYAEEDVMAAFANVLGYPEAAAAAMSVARLQNTDYDTLSQVVLPDEIHISGLDTRNDSDERYPEQDYEGLLRPKAQKKIKNTKRPRTKDEETSEDEHEDPDDVWAALELVHT
jgi:hypothetical protein